jgi:hypothetical protein
MSRGAETAGPSTASRDRSTALKLRSGRQFRCERKYFPSKFDFQANLSSRASDLKQTCHPDRSVAKWRDLLSNPTGINRKWKRPPPLCHPERSRGICSSTDLSWKCFRPERKRSGPVPACRGGTCCFFSSAHEEPHYKVARLSGLESDATLTGLASNRVAAPIFKLNTASLLKANKVPPSAVTCNLVA